MWYPGQYGEGLRVQHIDVAILRGHYQTADCVAFSIRLVQCGDGCGHTLMGGAGWVKGYRSHSYSYLSLQRDMLKYRHKRLAIFRVKPQEPRDKRWVSHRMCEQCAYLSERDVRGTPEFSLLERHGLDSQYATACYKHLLQRFQSLTQHCGIHLVLKLGCGGGRRYGGHI